MTDLTRFLNGFQKKAISVFTALVEEGTDADQGEVAPGDFNHLLALLPPDALIVNAYINIEVASDDSTTAVLKLGTASGGGQIMTGADAKVVAVDGTFVPGVDTGTGIELWINSATGTDDGTAVGKYRVFVEYIEYTKNTGEYTNFN